MTAEAHKEVTGCVKFILLFGHVQNSSGGRVSSAVGKRARSKLVDKTTNEDVGKHGIDMTRINVTGGCNPPFGQVGKVGADLLWGWDAKEQPRGGNASGAIGRPLRPNLTSKFGVKRTINWMPRRKHIGPRPKRRNAS